MQIPEQITFMSQTWTIQLVNSRELTDCLGLCNPRTNTILLDDSLPESVMLQTLFHELTHLIELTLNQCLTEQQVDTMASGLVHLLKANPQIIKMFGDDSELYDSFTQSDNT